MQKLGRGDLPDSTTIPKSPLESLDLESELNEQPYNMAR